MLGIMQACSLNKLNLHQWSLFGRLGLLPPKRGQCRTRRSLSRIVAFSNNSSSGHLKKNSQAPTTLDIEIMSDIISPSTDTSTQQLTTGFPHLRSWYGEDGELVSKLPCPDCRGRGYVICPRCEFRIPESSCIRCSGKGLMTCLRCSGNRVVLVQPESGMFWEHERPSCSSAPVIEVEDDEVIENMDITIPPKRVSKRVYSSPSEEVRQKIRHALKSLDARTGSVTRRMRRIHNDPILNAKRVAAIKRAKSTEASRKNVSEKLRLYFQDPANRKKRSESLKGVDFYCSFCGQKGHRRHCCPDLPESAKRPRSYCCSLCGKSGHKRTSCTKSQNNIQKTLAKKVREYRCGICRGVGHNKRSCQKKSV